MKRVLLSAVASVALFGLSSKTQAALIFSDSFESPYLSQDTLSPNYYPTPYRLVGSGGVPTGWSSLAGGDQGVYNTHRTDAYYDPDPAKTYKDVVGVDGDQFVFLDGDNTVNGTIYRNNITTYQEGTYTLEILARREFNTNATLYAFLSIVDQNSLLPGGITVTQSSLGSGFTNLSATFVIDNTFANLGDALGIFIQASGTNGGGDNNMEVDNVRLSFEAAAVPEPTSLALVGASALGLLRRRK